MNRFIMACLMGIYVLLPPYTFSEDKVTIKEQQKEKMAIERDINSRKEVIKPSGKEKKSMKEEKKEEKKEKDTKTGSEKRERNPEALPNPCNSGTPPSWCNSKP